MRISRIAAFLAVLVAIPAGLSAASLPPRAAHQVTLPAFFLETERGVYIAHSKGFSAQFTAQGVTLRDRGGSMTVRFAGASPRPSVEPGERMPAAIQIVLGNRPSAWRSGVPGYQRLTYRELYPGIDAVYQAGGSGLKSEYRVSPGADPARIRLAYGDGAKARVGRDGCLIVTSGRAELREAPLEVFEDRGGERRKVAGRYHVYPDGTVGFRLGGFDRSLPLVIDPALAYSTYLGGGLYDAATAIALDASGYAYVAGWTESADLPTAGGIQSGSGGGVDAFVAKLSRDGSTLLYFTYLGGSALDRALGIAVDPTGNAYVTGYTESIDFPVVAPYQTNRKGVRNAFVTKISADGASMVYSTYLGGSTEDAGNAIAVDSAGRATVAGETTSTDFPVLSAVQSTPGGGSDAFVTRLSAAGAGLVFSTYLGGSGDDRATGVALDSSANAYITGGTGSTGFPLSGALQNSLHGVQDAFVTKLAATGTIAYSTYLGGTTDTVTLPEFASAIAVDSSGCAYIAGLTNATDFPIFNAYRSSRQGTDSDGFVSKLNAAGSALVYSTYLGGSGIDYATGIQVDSSGRAYVVGATTSTDFPAVSAYQSAKAGDYDGFLTEFSAAGNSIVNSTYLGGAHSDAASSVALVASRVAIAGHTLSTDFPLSSAVQSTNGGAYGAFVTTFGPAPSSGGSLFIPVTPCRVVDTRGYGKTGSFGPPSLAAGVERSFPIASGSCGIPATASAYALNITVVPPGNLGYLTAWPTGTARPEATVLYSRDGSVVANAAMVKAGTDGAIQVLASDKTDLIIDINGYFTPEGEGYEFFAALPCRVLDTRIEQGHHGDYGPPTLATNSARVFGIPVSGCGIPAAATAYSLNFTALPMIGYLQYLNAWPAGDTWPLVSTLNSWNGTVVANAAIVPAGASKKTAIFVADKADVLVDVNGYFGTSAPDGYRYFPIPPCRFADSRSTGSPRPGSFGPPSYAAREARILYVPKGECSIPSSAAGYSLNVSAMPVSTLSYLMVWPVGSPFPSVSTLNSFNGRVVANAAIVPAGTDGGIAILTSDAADVIVDINGYFAP
jgi:hypothetical protein